MATTTDYTTWTTWELQQQLRKDDLHHAERAAVLEELVRRAQPGRTDHTEATDRRV